MADEDVDNIDFANYKGIYAEDESEQKYTCPTTGAHFEFNDVCRRLSKVLIYRKQLEDKEKKDTVVKGAQQNILKQQQVILMQKQKQLEAFSSSTVSISEEIAVKNNFHSSQLGANGGVSGGKLRKTSQNAQLSNAQQINENRLNNQMKKKVGDQQDLLDSLEPAEQQINSKKKEDLLKQQYKSESHNRVAKQNNFFTDPEEFTSQQVLRDQKALAAQLIQQHQMQYASQQKNYGLHSGPEQMKQQMLMQQQQEELYQQQMKEQNRLKNQNNSNLPSSQHPSQQQLFIQQNLINHQEMVIGSKTMSLQPDNSEQPQPQFIQKGAKSATNRDSRQNPAQHQRTIASHFATQDNRVSQDQNLSSGRQKAQNKHQSIISQPYASIGSNSQANQSSSIGKRKSTSIKTGDQNSMQLSLQQMQGKPITSDQYNQLIQQLIKNSNKKATVQSHQSGRTRTKTTSSGAIVGTVQTQQQLVESKKKLNTKLSQGSQQFVGIVNGGQQNNTFQQQTFGGGFQLTNSAQYYNNGLQSNSPPKVNKTAEGNSSSIPRNRDGSSSSIGARQSVIIQNSKQNFNGYLRTSQTKSTKNGASRNPLQSQGIGGPVNTQNSKQQHRSFNSINQIGTTVPNGAGHLSMSGQKQRANHGSVGQSLNAQKLAVQGQVNPVIGGNHQVIDDVVFRLSQNQNPHQQYSQYQAVVPNQVHASRNKPSQMQQSHTVGASIGQIHAQNTITIQAETQKGIQSQIQNFKQQAQQNKNGAVYFDNNAFQEVMAKYQKSQRGSSNNEQSQPVPKLAQPQIYMQNAKTITIAQHPQTSSGQQQIYTQQLASQKQQVQKMQQQTVTNKESKSRNPNQSNYLVASKTSADKMAGVQYMTVDNREKPRVTQNQALVNNRSGGILVNNQRPASGISQQRQQSAKYRGNTSQSGQFQAFK